MNEDKFSISKDLLKLMCFVLPQFKPRYLLDLHRELNPNQIEETIVWDAFSSINGDDRFLFYSFFNKDKSLPKEKELFFRENGFFLRKIGEPNFP
jgi:hypothetical protein